VRDSSDKVDLNRRLDAMYTDGRRRVDDIRAMAKDAIRYVYGDQHAGRERKKGWEYPVINRMYADMTQEVAILGTTRIGIETLPVEETDEQDARAVGKVLRALWFRDLAMDIRLIQALVDKSLYGFAVFKWLWEEQAEWDEELAERTGNGWRGRIEVNVILPEYFGCDPDVELAAEIPTKARYVYTSRFMDKAAAARRWPEYRKLLAERGELDADGELKADATGDSQSAGRAAEHATDETGFNRSSHAWSGRERPRNALEDEAYRQARLANLILGTSPAGPAGGRSGPNRATVEVQEFLFRDYRTEYVKPRYEPIPFGEPGTEHIIKQDGIYYDTTRPVNPESGESGPWHPADGENWPQRTARPGYRRPKYPNGRRVVRIVDGEKIIVVDEAWPYRHWNFAVVPHYLLPHLWVGVNCVEISRGFQDWMNNIGSHLLNYVKFFADPQLWVEEGSLAADKRKRIVNVPNWAGAIVRFTRGALRSGAAQRKEPPPMPSALFNIFEMLKAADQDAKGTHDVVLGRASKGGNTLGELQMLDRNSRQRLALQGVLLDKALSQVAEGVIELMQTHYEPGRWVRYLGESQGNVAASIRWTQGMADAKYDLRIEPVATLPYDKEREALRYRAALEAAGPVMLKPYLEKLGIANVDKLMAEHELIGPLTALMKLAQQFDMGPRELLAAIQKQLQLLQSLQEPVEAPVETVGVA